MPKTCSKCSQTLRGARVRDSRGRLVCLPCHRGGNPEPVRADSGVCLGCGRPMGARVLICTGCGRNQKTGEQLGTASQRVNAGVGLGGRAGGIALHPMAVAVWGTGVVVAMYVVARMSSDLASFYIFGTVLAWLGFGAYLLYRGWQEDGLIGAFYAHRFPLGGLIEDPSGRRLAAFWLLGVAGVCSVLLVMQYPEIAEFLPGMGRRPSRAVHDILLPPVE